MTLAEFAARARVTVENGASTWPPPIGAMSMTREDAEFLYALIRMAKPELIVETGTGLGVSARFMGEALKDNGHGLLLTYESKREYADQARPLLEGLPVEQIVGPCPLTLDADIVHIDSVAGQRAQEIKAWLTSTFKGLVVVHDSHRRYPELNLGDGVFLPGSDGFWLGHAK